MTVRELGQRMGSDELSEWIAFDNLYGLPDHFNTAAVAVNVARASGQTKLKPGDVLPYFEEGQRTRGRMSTAEMLARFRGVAAAQNARVARGEA